MVGKEGEASKMYSTLLVTLTVCLNLLLAFFDLAVSIVLFSGKPFELYEAVARNYAVDLFNYGVNYVCANNDCFELKFS
jgi:hypothetical protein